MARQTTKAVESASFNFVEEVIKFHKETPAKELALEIQESAESALDIQISVQKGVVLQAKKALRTAEKALVGVRVNQGKDITNPTQYVTNLRNAHQAILTAKSELEDAEADYAMLEAEYELVK